MSSSTPMLSNKAYDTLKPVTSVLLPGLGALYFALAQIWGLPKAEEIVGTIAALNVFLGIVQSLSTRSYNGSDEKYDGEIEVKKTDDGGKVFTLDLNSDPDQLDSKNEVSFKIVTS